MQTYEFSLTFSLAGVDDPKRVVQHLYHTTCHDALICIIDEEHIEVCFEREAPSLSLAQERHIYRSVLGSDFPLSVQVVGVFCCP